MKNAEGVKMFASFDQRFIQLVHEMFGPTMEEFGFEFQGENPYLFYARNGDIQIIFRLEGGYQFRLFSLEIALSGELGDGAASDPHYRHMGITTFAKYLDPGYKPLGVPSTEDEVIESMQLQKRMLLKYSADLFNGDVSRWQTVVHLIKKEQELDA